MGWEVSRTAVVPHPVPGGAVWSRRDTVSVACCGHLVVGGSGAGTSAARVPAWWCVVDGLPWAVRLCALISPEKSLAKPCSARPVVVVATTVGPRPNSCWRSARARASFMAPSFIASWCSLLAWRSARCNTNSPVSSLVASVHWMSSSRLSSSILPNWFSPSSCLELCRRTIPQNLSPHVLTSVSCLPWVATNRYPSTDPKGNFAAVTAAM